MGVSVRNTEARWLTSPCSIVFVHGLQGHPEKTWTYFSTAAATSRKRPFLSSLKSFQDRPHQRPVFWPHDLLSTHPSVSQARLLTWGYDTQVLHFFGASNQQNISRHGNDLMIALQQERKSDVRLSYIYIYIHSPTYSECISSLLVL